MEISASGIPIAELTGFSLACIEKLACAGSSHTSEKCTLERILMLVVTEKLPSHIRLRAELKHSLITDSEPCVRYTQQQHRTQELRQRVEAQEDNIAKHLIITGEEIGLPTPLLAKLANHTKIILKRCCI